MKVRLVHILWAAALVLMPNVSYAQNRYGQVVAEDGLLEPFIRYPDAPARITELRDQWAEATLSWVDATLRAHPPSYEPAPIRIQALAALDDPIHLGEAPVLPVIADYFQRRVEPGLQHLEARAKVKKGALVWKFYNFTFIVRTPRHTFGFDVSHGFRDVAMSSQQLRRIAQQVDVAFISHDHPDHADVVFAEHMAALGKRVVIPEKLWPDSSIESALIRVKGHFTGSVAGVSFTAFPGSQGSTLPNPVYLVAADGMTFMHMGDQSRGSDFDVWIKGLGRRHEVSLLLVNCRDGSMKRKIKEIDPDLVIPGHENEIRHIVDGRQGVVRTLSNLEGVEKPFVLMHWGEHFHYVPADAMAR
jgi:L-ascorbate metabolism protein UlaG (beta-lactamase superfamily)